jgi:hypothetical protein
MSQLVYASNKFCWPAGRYYNVGQTQHDWHLWTAATAYYSCSLSVPAHTVPKMDGKGRVIRHSDHDSSANKPDFSLKNIA